MQLNRTTAIIYYLSISAIALVLLIALVRLPKFIFVGFEDGALSILLFAACIFICLSSIIYIFDFFLIRLGIYPMIRMRHIELMEKIKKIEREQRAIRSDINKLFWKSDE